MHLKVPKANHPRANTIEPRSQQLHLWEALATSCKLQETHVRCFLTCAENVDAKKSSYVTFEEYLRLLEPAKADGVGADGRADGYLWEALGAIYLV